MLPWLDAPLRDALEGSNAHALLIHGSADVGQLEFALALARGWLCESTTAPMGSRPCGQCASCRLVAAGSHPDLLVLVPEAMRETAGAAGGGDDDGEEKSSRKKPSKEIRVDEVRVAVAFALTTSARGRGKVVVVHPAERMNAIAANAFLKTLEEPAGDARFLLCSAAPDALLPTIRSRCQALRLRLPTLGESLAWMREQGVEGAEVLLAASGGQPREAVARAAAGIDAASWKGLPARVAAGDSSAFRGWPLPLAIDALQKLCHDAACVAAGAAPRFFPADTLSRVGSLPSLLHYARELSRFARHADHPWIADLGVESLVTQGREALHTPRSSRRGPRVQ